MDFLMSLGTELATTLDACNIFYSFEILSLQLIEQGFQRAGVASIRKRHLPLETVLWSIVGMGLFRQRSVWGIATQVNIMLPGKTPLVASSALVQARQRLGSEVVQQVFLFMVGQ